MSSSSIVSVFDAEEEEEEEVGGGAFPIYGVASSASCSGLFGKGVGLGTRRLFARGRVDGHVDGLPLG